MQDYPKWTLLSKKIPKNHHEVLDILIENRNLSLEDKSPFEYFLKDLKIDQKEFNKAFKRLNNSLKNKEKIIIYGDYDADGICATAVLWETLHSLGFNVMPFIPDRFKDGYGINQPSIERILKENKDLKLIITVDNGVVANKAVDFCNKEKVDVIITDHHAKSEKVPNSHSLIHTTLTSGSAIAWVFSRYIEKKLTKSQKLSEKTLELASIGTVADQLPLVGFNRSLVKLGIQNLRKTSRVGLESLFEISSFDQPKLGTYEINYQIAPRINASGRLASGMDALRLLCTRDKAKALKLARNLNELNTERQELVYELVELADKQVSDRKIIVVSSEEFHEGVIGLIASRLTEKYYRPAIVLSVDGDKAKASARSIKGFSISNLINDFRSEILEGGGHDMAGGFSIDKKNIKNFEKKILKHYNSFLTADILTKNLEIDVMFNQELLDFSILNHLESLEPFGIGNKKPLFMIESVSLSDVKAIGKEFDHLKFSISKFDSIYFRKGSLVKEITENKKYDLVFSLEKNVWNGKESLQIIVKDIRENNGKRVSRVNKTSKRT